MTTLSIGREERQNIGEALLVYIFRALGKPNRTSYFHTRLLDVLVKSVRDSFQLAIAIKWANGTSFIKQFNSKCRLDDHPEAPQWAVAEAFSKGESFALLSDDAIKRIQSMTAEKRRQLEALAAALFPDHEAIRGKGQLYSGAKVVPEKDAFLTSEEQRSVERSELGPMVGRSTSALEELEKSLTEVFSDPGLGPHERDRIQRELEDLLIGRLELEQPVISVELIMRLFTRSLAKIADWSASALVGNMAQKAAASLAAIFPVFGAAA